MSSLRPPQLLSDLYRDLRDRRMLVPAIALLVAILVVPVLLSSSAGEEAVAPAAAAPAQGAAATEPAVLVEEAGIRDYRKRLAALKSKNPFDQKFTLPPAGAAVVEEVDGGLAVAGTGADTADTVATADTTDPAISGLSSSAPTTSDTGSTPEDSERSPQSDVGAELETSEPLPPPEIRFYAGRVDVSMGPIGEGKEFDDVRYLSFLPNDKAPLVAYLGLVGGGDRAIFSISSAVEMGDGEGSCAPHKPAPCQFLTLKVGEERYMSYGTSGETYRLKLLDTDIVSVPDPRDPDDVDD